MDGWYKIFNISYHFDLVAYISLIHVVYNFISYE